MNRLQYQRMIHKLEELQEDIEEVKFMLEGLGCIVNQNKTWIEYIKR